MAPFRTNTVVVADDFAAFRGLVRSKLQENGFHIVAEASDGLEAVARVAESQPDLVLLDIVMPNLNGIEASAQIRAIAPHSKVLFLSLMADVEIVDSALRDGALGYVCKSKIDNDLLPGIEAALAGKRFISPNVRPA